jgi:hypothetical protein
MSPGGQEPRDSGIHRICIPDAAERGNLAVFVERALRLDEAAVIRLHTRTDGLVAAWVATGFDVLACRVLAGGVQPPDVTCSADALRAGLAAPDESGCCDFGYSMDSAWRTALPPETGFFHLDDVPANVLFNLARQGADLAREHAGPQGPPASLLDQEVLQVMADKETLGVPMRCVMALVAMGFITGAGDEIVRFRLSPSWLRIDAHYGSVFRRRGAPSLFLR